MAKRLAEDPGFIRAAGDRVRARIQGQESRLRRVAKQGGYVLRKSRVRSIHANNHGEYMLVNSQFNGVVLGANFDATLSEVEAFLKKRS